MASKTYGNKDRVASVRLRPIDVKRLKKIAAAARKAGKLRVSPSVTEVLRAALELASRYSKTCGAIAAEDGLTLFVRQEDYAGIVPDDEKALRG